MTKTRVLALAILLVASASWAAKRRSPAAKMVRPKVVTSQANYYVEFRYPSNYCDFSWTLQVSTNLVDWADITRYECAPSGSNVFLDTIANQPMAFYRLRGQSK